MFESVGKVAAGAAVVATFTAAGAAGAVLGLVGGVKALDLVAVVVPGLVRPKRLTSALAGEVFQALIAAKEAANEALISGVDKAAAESVAGGAHKVGRKTAAAE